MDNRSLLAYFNQPAPEQWSLFDPWRYALQNYGPHYESSLLPRQSSQVPVLFNQYLKELQKEFETVQKLDEKGFQFRIDVQQFKPEEVTVSLNDNFVIVEGKHEERSDAHGSISRHFTRKFAMPKGKIDVGKLQCNLSSDGILTITAPKLEALENQIRVIPITHTGPVRESIKGKETNGKLHEIKNGDAKIEEKIEQKEIK